MSEMPLILRVSNVPDTHIKTEGTEFDDEESREQFDEEKQYMLGHLGVNIIAIDYNNTMYSYVKILADDVLMYFMPSYIILKCNPKKYEIGGKRFSLMKW